MFTTVKVNRSINTSFRKVGFSPLEEEGFINQPP